MDGSGTARRVLNYLYVGVVGRVIEEKWNNMARRTRGSRTTRKVNLRTAYDMGGYTGDYSWFIREKVIPIIGAAALHSIPSREGSRVREYSVTQRNLHRVVKALGIESDRYKQLQAVKKAVSKAGAQAAAEVILNLVEQTEQPIKDPNFPIKYRIPIHPISHNMLYEAKGGRMVKTKRYSNWRKEFFPLIQQIVPKTGHGVDFTKPLEVRFYFGHREKSRGGGTFDRPNFQKAVQDCIFEHFGYEDSKALDTSVSGEFVDDYSSGFIEFSIRNT